MEAGDGLELSESGENFKVVVRVRPPLAREVQGARSFEPTVLVESSGAALIISENLKARTACGGTGFDNFGLAFPTYQFTFDHVHDVHNNQLQVYTDSARGAVLSTLQGYNAAIIAYGQTGTGKTYTMEGGGDEATRGIIPRAIEDIFATIENDSGPHSKYLVRASYLQVYNEVISDLLKPERQNLVIREDKRRGVYVDGLSEWVVRSPLEVHSLLVQGAQERVTGATKLNHTSSRSHAVFIIIVENSASSADQGASAANSTAMQAYADISPGMDAQSDSGKSSNTHQVVKVGKLNLVDLAGSERVHITGATGKRLEESKKINQSLSALGNVIAALTDGRGARPHVPYRDSKLTRILEDSVGGNCKTTMMAMISPAPDAFAESLSTLKFANRAKRIRNLAHVNEDADQRTLLRKYERELRRLRAELQQRQRDVIDKRHLLAVEEQKRRAEADKLAAITALEQRSREFMQEKEAKRRLEHRIAAMQSQLLISGQKIEETPVFRTLLAREQRRMRGEYEERLRELEREAAAAEAGKAAADRYRALLLKQRDIMVALTARLGERDAAILALQAELESTDRHRRQAEDALDQRTAELIALRKAAVEHAAASPLKSRPLQFALGAWANTGQGAVTTPSSAPASGATPASDGGPAAKEVSMSSQPSPSDQSSFMQVTQASTPSADAQQLAMLQEQHITAAKERAALKTILDAKMRPLVSSIADSLDGDSGERQPGPSVQRQLTALDRLLRATIAAM